MLWLQPVTWIFMAGIMIVFKIAEFWSILDINLLRNWDIQLWVMILIKDKNRNFDSIFYFISLKNNKPRFTTKSTCQASRTTWACFPELTAGRREQNPKKLFFHLHHVLESAHTHEHHSQNSNNTIITY